MLTGINRSAQRRLLKTVIPVSNDQFPRAKLCNGLRDKTIIVDDEGTLCFKIDFGKEVVWMGLPKEQATAFANLILARANLL
jgi:hypothetical protein